MGIALNLQTLDVQLFDWKLSKAVQLQRPRPYDKPATTETRQPHDYAASNTAGKTDTASRAAGL